MYTVGMFWDIYSSVREARILPTRFHQDSTSFAAGSNKNHTSVGSEAIKAYLLDLCWKPLIDLPSFGLLFASANFALTSQH